MHLNTINVQKAGAMRLHIKKYQIEILLHLKPIVAPAFSTA